MNGVLPRGYNALSEHSPVVTAVCVFIFLYDLLFMFPKIDLNCKKWTVIYFALENWFNLRKGRILFFFPWKRRQLEF